MDEMSVDPDQLASPEALKSHADPFNVIHIKLILELKD